MKNEYSDSSDDNVDDDDDYVKLEKLDFYPRYRRGIGHSPTYHSDFVASYESITSGIETVCTEGCHVVVDRFENAFVKNEEKKQDLQFHSFQHENRTRR